MNESLRIGDARGAVDAWLAGTVGSRFAERLWAHDATLWSADPAHQKVAANRLGWLELPSRMEREIAELEGFAAEVAKEGYTHAVLLGMGGSSLAPEVLRQTLGAREDRLDLAVLDNTSPAAVRAVLDAHDLAHTLFLVSSKSGSTIEVSCFEKFFFEQVRERVGGNAGRAFVAITDPGTALETLAESRGYRRVFHAPPDVGGRYSALTFFGLVPAALIGADLRAMHAAARDEALACGPSVPALQNPSVLLGASLGQLALAGRDKVTLVPGAEFESLGNWIEQLVAESTGKDGKGLVPIAGEPLAEPSAYGDDRVFVAVTVGTPPPDMARRLEELAAAGHPVIQWQREATTDLGAEFLRWEIATATAGAVLGVDPFDEPNVTQAKEATRAALDRYLADGRFPEAPRDKVELDALLTLARPGDYFAVLAYLCRSPFRHVRLERARVTARERTRLATTLGYGPRYLHSTGQLHKGGPNTGIFLLLTGDEGEDVAIPGERFTFAALRRAQAAGDHQVLTQRGRRVLHVDLGADTDIQLDQVAETLAAGAPQGSRPR